MAKLVAIHDADKRGYPNLALMKLSAWHKAQGDSVIRFSAMYDFDAVYSSKVFSWTKKDPYLPKSAILGGTGYNIKNFLPDAVEHFCPDYSLYGLDFSLGFLTRGCIRHCAWCIVPEKEGEIRPHADIEEFCRHKDVILMDNNVLACGHGVSQIEKMARLGLRVDFNQGLDARLIDREIARRLAALRWIRFIRLACDHKSQMPNIKRAVSLLRAAGCRKELSCYVLVQDIPDALERVEFLRGLDVVPFAQPYRPTGSAAEPDKELKRFARWVNLRRVFRITSWDEYKDGFRYGQQAGPDVDMQACLFDGVN